MATASGLRIGDSDREAAAASLREHYAQGRLSLDEFQHRLNAVFAAKTFAELDRITADLPHVGDPYPPVWISAPPVPAGQRSWEQGGSSGSGSSRGAGRSRASALAGMLMMFIAIAVVVSVIAPFSLFGLAASRPLVVLFGIVMVVRRLFRWVIGTGTRRRR